MGIDHTSGDASAGFMKENKDRSASKIRKTKQNSGPEYYAQGGKIIPTSSKKSFKIKIARCLKNCINLLGKTNV